MSGRPFRRTALPCAVGRSAHLVLALTLALAALAFFCAGLPARAASAPRPHSVSAAPADPSVAVRASQVERDPCDHDGGHDCHSSDPRAVLAHAPLPGADHTAAPWQPGTVPAAAALDGSGTPGRARPPDLHQLQLLRV
ncbi:DUF6153 family protein [Streptomyces sp. NPDC002643]